MSSLTDAGALDLAIAEAKAGRKEGGLYNHVTGQLIGSGRNQRVQMGSSIRHGETDCLEKCGRLPASVYKQCTMVTTLSPCDMCTGAMLLYKIPRCVIGENRSFVGGEELLKARGLEVVVLDSKECVEMMAEFTAAEPRLWDEDIGE